MTALFLIRYRYRFLYRNIFLAGESTVRPLHTRDRNGPGYCNRNRLSIRGPYHVNNYYLENCTTHHQFPPYHFTEPLVLTVRSRGGTLLSFLCKPLIDGLKLPYILIC